MSWPEFPPGISWPEFDLGLRPFMAWAETEFFVDRTTPFVQPYKWFDPGDAI
jgi:hypothetical protein